MNLTLLIPTKNRPFFLAKTLRYYAEKKAGFLIRIGDASDHAYLEQNRALVKKYESVLRIRYSEQDPSTITTEGTNQLLRETDTPYCVWAGDDDFIVPETALACVDFLEKNSDYATAGGATAWLYAEAGKNNALRPQFLRAGPAVALEQSDAEKRVVTYANPAPRINTFFVQRTDTMRFTWATATKLGLCRTRYHLPLHEVSVNVVGLIRGKQFVFPRLFHVMVRHSQKNHASQGHADSFERFLQWDWGVEVRGMLDWWAQELMKATGHDRDRSYSIAVCLFLFTIDKFVTIHREQRLDSFGLLPQKPLHKQPLSALLGKVPGVKKIWKKKIGEDHFTLERFLSPASSFHADFAPIYKSIVAEESAPAISLAIHG